MHWPSVIIGFVSGVALLIALWSLGVLVAPWSLAWCSGAPVSLPHALGMRLRGNAPSIVIDAYIRLQKQGHDASLAEIETAFIASRPGIHSADDLVQAVTARAATCNASCSGK